MKRKTKKAGEKDEVEELLQAAQDDMLLKLSLDSHLSHGVSLHDANIERRFQALKLKTITTTTTAAGAGAAQSKSRSNWSNSLQVDDELKAVLGDDLSTRFAALKASSSSSSTVTTAAATSSSSYHDNDDEDEVEKLMRWAKDAARLDPSPPSDDDDDNNDDNDKSECQSESESESEDDEEDDDPKPKGKGPNRK